MRYNVRRIDPYWWAHPAVPAMIVIGAALGVAGEASKSNLLLFGGGALVGLGIFLGVKPVVSAVLGVLGIVGGVLHFVVVPNPQYADWALWQKFAAGAMYGLLYMLLMDAVVLAIAVLYNFFAAFTDGVKVDIEGTEDEEA